VDVKGENNPLPLPGIESQLLSQPARNLVPIPNILLNPSDIFEERKKERKEI
jgi:hypothetical protein